MKKFTITEERLAALEKFYEPYNVECMLESIDNIEGYFLDCDHPEGEEELRTQLYTLTMLRDLRKHLKAMTCQEGGAA